MATSLQAYPSSPSTNVLFIGKATHGRLSTKEYAPAALGESFSDVPDAAFSGNIRGSDPLRSPVYPNHDVIFFSLLPPPLLSSSSCDRPRPKRHPRDRDIQKSANIAPSLQHAFRVLFVFGRAFCLLCRHGRAPQGAFFFSRLRTCLVCKRSSQMSRPSYDVLPCICVS